MSKVINMFVNGFNFVIDSVCNAFGWLINAIRSFGVKDAVEAVSEVAEVVVENATEVISESVEVATEVVANLI